MTDDIESTPKVTALRKPKDQQEAAPMPELPPSPSAALLLPSEHVDFVSVMENELNNRVHGLNSGIMALEGVLDGRQRQHNEAVANMSASWEAEKADLLRRIDNLKTALRMAKSGVAAKDVPQ